MIRVLVAEDSSTVRALLLSVLESDPDMEVVGVATNGEEAVRLAVELRPDLITMDIHMPVMDGLEATKEIMVTAPTPIVVVSSSTKHTDVDRSFDTMRAGALMLLEKPIDASAPAFADRRAHFLRMLKAMADVKVVHRWTPLSRGAPPPRAPAGRIEIVVIAASTGGPAALLRVLRQLPRDFRVPIVVVQHITAGFVPGLADWLASGCDLRVKVADDGERLASRTVYLAPDDRHVGVRPDGSAGLSGAAPIGGHRPSATYLFDSAARAYGERAVAVILTGMGRDGVEGLRAIKRAGGVVIAQDQPTSVVFGMPGEAISAGVVDSVLPIEYVAESLVALVEAGTSTRGERAAVASSVVTPDRRKRRGA